MNSKKIIAATLLMSSIGVVSARDAQALSCITVSEYISSVIGDEDVVIFEGTSADRMETDEYTTEVVTVTDAKQGWIESSVFVYHQKHPDWGYLCNAGPQAVGTKSVYVATRNDQQQYSIQQTVSVNDKLAQQIDAEIEKAGVEGGVAETTKTDRKNQIMTTIGELFAQISRLLKEYAYWSK